MSVFAVFQGMDIYELRQLILDFQAFFANNKSSVT